MDLMEMAKGAVSQQLMGKIGGMLGTDEKKTSSVFEMATGSILGGLIKKSATPEGARDVFEMVEKQDASVLDNLGEEGPSEEVAEAGGGLLEGIFGEKQGGMMEMLANAVGLKREMLDKVLKFLAPVVMGVIAKQVKSNSMDAVGLGNLLGEQKKSLGFMPASLTEGLGVGDLMSSVSDAGKAAGGAVGAASSMAGGAASEMAGGASKLATSAVSDAASGGSGLMKMLLPLLVLAALIFGGWKLYPMLMGGAAEVAEKVEFDPAQLRGVDLKSIDGFDFESLGAVGGPLMTGMGSITSGFEGLSNGGDVAAEALNGKIRSFTDSIDGMGLDKLEGAGKKSATGLISKFIEAIKNMVSGQSEGIQEKLKPAIDALIEKLNPLAG